jgi:glycosyltransferase involved in cell wall biosynthesis
MASNLSTERPVILLVEHGLGGGVARHVDDLVELLQQRAQFLRLTPGPGGLLHIRHGLRGNPAELYFDPGSELPMLERLLRASGVTRVHFHHTVRLPQWVLTLPARLGVPYDYTVHDYFSFCPQITLTDEHFKYCGEPDEVGCTRCLAQRPPSTGEDIVAWRSRYRAFVESAARVLAPSPSVAARLLKHFPGAAVVVAAHPERPQPARDQRPTWSYRDGLLKIGLLGALNAVKGADLLEECAIDARRRALPLEFHLIGYAYRALRTEPRTALQIYGRYDDHRLDDLIRQLGPHIIWFPAQWPETYSYTLSAALRCGIPVAATDLGAIHDRLSDRLFSWMLPWDTQASAWNDFFMRLREGSPEADLKRAHIGNQKMPTFSYERDYVGGQGLENTLFPTISFDARPYTQAYRMNLGFVLRCVGSFIHGVLRSTYRIPGVHRVATAVARQHRLQTFRRWLDHF